MKRAIAILLLGATCGLADETTPGYVPSSDTVIASRTVRLGVLHLNNKSGSSVADCVLKDRSTNCGGEACPLFGPTTLGAANAAASAVTWDFGGLQATNGFTWSCGTGSAVVGRIAYSNFP